MSAAPKASTSAAGPLSFRSASDARRARDAQVKLRSCPPRSCVADPIRGRARSGGLPPPRGEAAASLPAVRRVERVQRTLAHGHHGHRSGRHDHRKAPIRQLHAVEPDRNEQVFSPELDPSVDAVGGQGLGGGDAAGGAGQRREDGCRLVGVQIDDRQVQNAACVPARRDCARTTRRQTASFELPRGRCRLARS